jgi:lipopolysaccharide/colanic/teichoic acid biosynthesis glycosyltransferase
MDYEEQIVGRVESDIYYIENLSLWLDIRIVTAFRGWVHKNAY